MGRPRKQKISLFLYETKILQNTKIMIHKWNSVTLNFINIKNFWSSKDIDKGIKRYISEWEKVFAQYTSHQILLSIQNI